MRICPELDEGLRQLDCSEKTTTRTKTMNTLKFGTSMILLVCLAPVRSLADVCSTPIFEKARSFYSGTDSVFVAEGDFNGDGKLDMAAATREGVSVLLGNGDATFQ